MTTGFNLGVYGVPEHSLFDLSSALKALHISHRIFETAKDAIEINLTSEQPARVYLVRNFAQVQKIDHNETAPYIIFVNAPEAELALTNCIILRGSAKHALKSALKASHPRKVASPFVFMQTSKSLDDYVNEATKPTFLYFIQTAIYKLTPYALVKEARTIIISALYGAIPMKKLYAFLGTSLKLEDLKMILKDDKAKQVRELVLEVRKRIEQEGTTKREDDIVNSVIAGTGIDAFDILYVVKSYQKMEREKASGKRRGRPPKEKLKKGRR